MTLFNIWSFSRKTFNLDSDFDIHKIWLGARNCRSGFWADRYLLSFLCFISVGYLNVLPMKWLLLKLLQKGGLRVGCTFLLGWGTKMIIRVSGLGIGDVLGSKTNHCVTMSTSHFIISYDGNLFFFWNFDYSFLSSSLISFAVIFMIFLFVRVWLEVGGTDVPLNSASVKDWLSYSSSSSPYGKSKRAPHLNHINFDMIHSLDWQNYNAWGWLIVTGFLCPFEPYFFWITLLPTLMLHSLTRTLDCNIFQEGFNNFRCCFCDTWIDSDIIIHRCHQCWCSSNTCVIVRNICCAVLCSEMAALPAVGPPMHSLCCQYLWIVGGWWWGPLVDGISAGWLVAHLFLFMSSWWQCIGGVVFARKWCWYHDYTTWNHCKWWWHQNCL